MSGPEPSQEVRMKKVLVLGLAAAAALFVRRQQQSRPTAEVWRDATRTT